MFLNDWKILLNWPQIFKPIAKFTYYFKPIAKMEFFEESFWKFENQKAVSNVKSNANPVFFLH